MFAGNADVVVQKAEALLQDFASLVSDLAAGSPQYTADEREGERNEQSEVGSADQLDGQLLHPLQLRQLQRHGPRDLRLDARILQVLRRLSESDRRSEQRDAERGFLRQRREGGGFLDFGGGEGAVGL